MRRALAVVLLALTLTACGEYTAEDMKEDVSTYCDEYGNLVYFDDAANEMTGLSVDDPACSEEVPTEENFN